MSAYPTTDIAAIEDRLAAGQTVTWADLEAAGALRDAEDENCAADLGGPDWYDMECRLRAETGKVVATTDRGVELDDPVDN